MMEALEFLATGRRVSLFSQGAEALHDQMSQQLGGSRILVIGAAGSIGASVVKCLLHYPARSLSLIDLSENNLVELIRLLRSDARVKLPKDLELLPLDYGSPEFYRYLKDSPPFDYILNLSAMKHVRSEKDIYSLTRMLKTNVLYLHQLISGLEYTPKKVFSVSSDKAVHSANLMGASKALMERVLVWHSDKMSVSSARFANVAFSLGSLPYGFTQRIQASQPLSAPNDIKRFFISHEEAGQLCVFSAVLGGNEAVFFPDLEPVKDERMFTDIAIGYLNQLGYEPLFCSTEEEAKEKMNQAQQTKKWPCLFAPSDTAGEKGFEEFVREDEVAAATPVERIHQVRMNFASGERERFADFLMFLEDLDRNRAVTKGDVLSQVRKVVTDFKHIESEKNLDQKM